MKYKEKGKSQAIELSRRVLQTSQEEQDQSSAESIGRSFVPVVRPVAVATGAGAIVSSFVRTFVPVRASVRVCARVLMIEVLVRAMVERFESKGVGVIPVE